MAEKKSALTLAEAELDAADAALDAQVRPAAAAAMLLLLDAVDDVDAGVLLVFPLPRSPSFSLPADAPLLQYVARNEYQPTAEKAEEAGFPLVCTAGTRSSSSGGGGDESTMVLLLLLLVGGAVAKGSAAAAAAAVLVAGGKRRGSVGPSDAELRDGKHFDMSGQTQQPHEMPRHT